MTKAKRCDRCDAVEERDPALVDLKIRFVRVGDAMSAEAHLCDDCQRAFREWMGGGPEGQR